MNCKGCMHCQHVGKDDSAYIDHPFHYCDIYPEKETIGESFKWCEGTSYENKEGKKYFEV